MKPYETPHPVYRISPLPLLITGISLQSFAKTELPQKHRVVQDGSRMTMDHDKDRHVPPITGQPHKDSVPCANTQGQAQRSR